MAKNILSGLTSKQRLIFVSSISVYGTKNDGSFTETDQLDGNTSYARSKAKSEEMLMTHKNAVAFRLTRVASPYGKNIINLLHNKIMQNEDVSVSDSTIDVVGINDVIDILHQAIIGKFTGIYNLASGTPVPLLKIVLFFKHAYRSTSAINVDNNAPRISVVGNPSKLRNSVFFQPQDIQNILNKLL